MCWFRRPIGWDDLLGWSFDDRAIKALAWIAGIAAAVFAAWFLRDLIAGSVNSRALTAAGLALDITGACIIGLGVKRAVSPSDSRTRSPEPLIVTRESAEIRRSVVSSGVSKSISDPEDMAARVEFSFTKQGLAILMLGLMCQLIGTLVQ